MYKFAVITGFLGAIKNRFLEYQRDRNLEEKLQIAKDIKEINGVELCYPKDFEDVDKLKRIINNCSHTTSIIITIYTNPIPFGITFYNNHCIIGCSI